MGEVLGTRASEQKKKDFFCLFYLNCLLYYTFSPCFLRPCTFFTSFVFSYGKIAQFFRFPPSLLYEELCPRRKKLPLFFRTEKLRNFSIRKNKGSKRTSAVFLPQQKFCITFASLLLTQKEGALAVKDKVLRTKGRGFVREGQSSG